MELSVTRAAAPKDRNGFTRVLVAVWPVAFMLLALVPVLLRGYLGMWIIVVAVVLLLALFALVHRWELPGLTSTGRIRMIVYNMLAPTVAMTVVLTIAAEVGDGGRSAWLLGAVLLVATVVLTIAIVLVAVRLKSRWVVIASGVGAAVVSAVVAFLLSSRAEVDPGVWQTAVAAYFTLLCATALLRAVAYVNTLLRGLIAGLAVALSLYGIGHAASGVLDTVAPWDGRVALGFAVLIFLLVLFDGDQPVAGGARTTRVVARRFSLATTSLGTTALTAACLMATFGPTSVSAPDGVVVLEETPSPTLPVASLAKDPGRLAARFSPVLLFPDGDRWEPIYVEDYLESSPKRFAWAEWSDGSERLKASRKSLSEACPGTVLTPCRVVTIDCDDDRRGEGCDQGPGYVAKGEDGTGRALAYARVVDLSTCRGDRAEGGRLADEKCTVDATGRLGIDLVGKYREEVRFLVQYWYFYFYDRWSTTSLFGDLTQTHEGDWEAVTIGFSDSTPLFAAFSAHCGGEWQDWSDVTVAERGDDGLHPIALVARGSQAMYPGLKADVAPDWASCLGFNGAALSLVTFGLNVEEHVGSDVVLWSDEGDLSVVSEKDFPMNVLGRWGAANGEVRFTTVPGKRISPRSEELGPGTPTLQELWVQPLSRIFCSHSWKPKDCEEYEPVIRG